MRMGNGGNGRPRVVVVGGGFAGLSAVRELSGADVDVLLLDRNLYNTFQPLLYQVAAGGLNPGDITYALRAFAARYGNAWFRRACVSAVDAARRCVRTDTGEEIPYDYLLLLRGHHRRPVPGSFGLAGNRPMLGGERPTSLSRTGFPPRFRKRRLRD
jgi:NADH:ubiquinone reductase (H+-translocating)